MAATLVATSVVSGVGAVPWLERADGDGDGAEELGVGWSSLAGEAGAAASSGTAGLSCPAGMVLDGGLCKTPKVETVPVTLTCTQPGYVLVSTSGELGTSHSCQKTVAAHCTGGKVLHQGQCQTRTVEQRDANWSCSEGTLVSTFLDPGYSYSCRITVDPPECPDGESYLTTPPAGCYVEVSFHQTRDYTWTCTEGTLVTTAGDHGVARSCKVTLASLTCPDGETYRNSRCEEEQTFYRTRGYAWSCSLGTLVTTSGEHGVARSCKVTLSPPRCPDGETWRSNRCEEQQTFYRTRGYAWSCSSGTLVTTSGEHGVARSCKVTLSPPRCPNGETWRSNRCEKQQAYYDSRPYDYSCPSGYTLGTSGLTRTCTKTETYRKRVCSYDPLAGQQCWWENRTRTLTAAVRQTCPSGFSSDGTGCTADSPSVRWVATGSSPTRFRYDPATKSCISGYSPAGSVCRSDTASTRWAATGSSPTRFRYDPATKSCISGYSDNGSLCQASTASKRWVATGSSPTRLRYVSATKSCPSGWSDNGSLCRSDAASTRWDATGSTPITSRTADAVRSCDTDFAWNGTSGKCEKTAYADPTAPLTKLVGNPPVVSCGDGYKLAGGGRCSKTTLGEPTAVPTGAGCNTDLGSLGAGTVTRSATLAAGCVSLRKGNAQSPHWARRYTFTVPTASTATVTASSSAADTFLYVLTGSGADVNEGASDDDSGSGTDAKITSVPLVAGTAYTVEVTTSAANVTGAFTLTVTVAPDKPPVKITGLADAYDTSQAKAAASDGFTVEPAAATCTVSPADAKITVGRGDARTVSLSREAPFSQKVTVTCTATGRSAGTATATLRGHLAVASLTVTGSGCKAVTGGASDYQCTASAGGALSVSGTAQGPSSALSLAWAAAGGAKIDSQSQGKLQTAAPDAVPVVYSRASSATISCTEAGTVTLTAAAGVHKRAVRIAVVCEAAAPSVACDDPLGTLGEGTTARTGAVTADSGCVTASRRPGSSWVYYTRRHSFTLAGPALVSIDVGNDPANRVKLDTYAVLLGGHGADGKVLGRDDDGGPGSDSRIARKLAAGDYTIEATTWGSGRVGRYRLSVDTRHDRQVAIAGLADAAEAGADAVAVADGFTVTPVAARCAATPAAATVVVGKNPEERTVTAEVTAPGSVAVTVTCTAAGHADATKTVTLTAELAAGVATIGARAQSGGECKAAAKAPDGADAAYGCTMAEGASLQVEAEAAATAAGLAVAWAASGGVAVDTQSQGKATAVVGPDGSVLHRRVAVAALQCTADGTATATAKLGASAKTALLTVACLPPVEIRGLADTAATGTGQVTVTRAFTVAPAAARCQAEPDTATVAKGRRPADRTLSAKITAPGSLKITVTCRADGRAAGSRTVTLTARDACTADLGALAAGTVTRRGAITADAACTTAHWGRRGAHYVRRHTFTLAGPGRVSVGIGNDASNKRRLDTYLILLKGTGAQATVIGRDDDSGPGSDSRLSGVKLAPGQYTIEATTYRNGATGRYTLRVTAQPDVLIHGLNGNSIVGTGTAVDHFTVAPAAAACTSSTGTVTAGKNGRRVLTANLAALGTATVTVTCTRTGYRTATATSTLRALTPVSDVTVDADAEGSCTQFAGTLDAGVDKKYECTMTRGGQMILGAEATGPSAQMSLGWAAATGVRVVPALGDLDASVVGDAVVFAQSASGKVTCTADGDITVTVSIRGTAHHTTKIRVTCKPPVEITSYIPGTRNGPGPMTGTFDVAPSTAQCTARHTAGITGQYAAAAGTGTSRTVSVTTTATGALDVEVKCSNDGYAASTATATFSARDEAACSTALGALWHGSTSRTGTLSAASCTSAKRTPTSATFYAHRYTFTMATAGWATIDLVGTGTGADKLDTYAVVLYGHGSGGIERASDDDSGGNGDARLADLLLAAGKYTIEATTATNEATGAYRVRVQADFAARAPDQPARTTAVVGQRITRTWSHQPAAGSVSIQSVTPAGLDASIVTDDGFATLTATATHAGDYTVTVAYAASGHTSTFTTTVDADCPPRHVTTQTRTCTPLATTLPAACTATVLSAGKTWGKLAASRRFSVYSGDAGECMSLTRRGNSAAFFEFSVPAKPGALPVTVALDSGESGGIPKLVEVHGGRPSMSLWQYQDNGTSLGFRQTVIVSGTGRSTIDLDLSPGRYLVEISPTATVTKPQERFELAVTVPRWQHQYDLVQKMGHTGTAEPKLTLDEFVTTRANDHADYPYLTWTADDCSSWPDRYHAQVLTEEAATDDIVVVHNIIDERDLVERVVPVYRACWRHDFNWRNLSRIHHHVDHRAKSWTGETKSDADSQLERDMETLCRQYLNDGYWQSALSGCYLNAKMMYLGVSAIELGWYSNSDLGAPERVE